MPGEITVNRAPVLTLWAAVVAEGMGYNHEEALSLGKCVAGLNAQAKGRSLGIYSPPKISKGKPPKKAAAAGEFRVEICGRPVPAVRTPAGIRAVVKDKPIAPEPVERYLEAKFGEHFGAVQKALSELARSFTKDELKKEAFLLYEKFRPKISAGTAGWGAKGKLDLDLIRSLAR
jgi:hypothetical protein